MFTTADPTRAFPQQVDRFRRVLGRADSRTISAFTRRLSAFYSAVPTQSDPDLIDTLAFARALAAASDGISHELKQHADALACSAIAAIAKRVAASIVGDAASAEPVPALDLRSAPAAALHIIPAAATA